MPKSILTPAESSALILAAYKVQDDQNIEAFLAKVERIVLNRMFEQNETERRLGLSSQ